MVNSLQLFLDMISKTVNLVWLICIKKFEVTLQVPNRTKKGICKNSSNFNLKSFKLGFYYSKHCTTTVDVL
jgi:hypothetical protein